MLLDAIVLFILCFNMGLWKGLAVYFGIAFFLWLVSHLMENP